MRRKDAGEALVIEAVRLLFTSDTIQPKKGTVVAHLKPKMSKATVYRHLLDGPASIVFQAAVDRYEDRQLAAGRVKNPIHANPQKAVSELQRVIAQLVLVVENRDEQIQILKDALDARSEHE
jgi:transcription initiation factor TFIIIB Brf1 subunit/transcription initiation factor TFIIB